MKFEYVIRLLEYDLLKKQQDTNLSFGDTFLEASKSKEQLREAIYLLKQKENEEVHNETTDLNDEQDLPMSCDLCGGEDGRHELRCPNNESPFVQFLRDGYD